MSQQRRIDLALCDADVITYLAGFGAERVMYSLYPDDEAVLANKPALTTNVKKDIDALAEQHPECTISREMEHDPIEYALHKTKLILEKIIGHTECKEMKLFLSGPNNFREGIATYRKYKGNRDKSKRPQWYHAIREYMIKYWGAEFVEGQEADDELGIRQTNAGDKLTVICSTDKDLLQIPGLHYNIMRETLIEQQPEDAECIFYTQCITGDSTDNITGCPGLGKKFAERWFEEEGMSWPLVVEAYRQQIFERKLPADMSEIDLGGKCLMYKHHTEETDIIKTVEDFALEMAQLVYIRKQPEEIWTP